MNDFRMDRSAFKVSKLGHEPPAYEYWLTKSPVERISAIEFLRRQ